MKNMSGPTVKTVNYITLSSVLALVFKSEDDVKREERRTQIVLENGWPQTNNSITLLEGQIVLEAVESYTSNRKTILMWFHDAYRSYRLNEYHLIDIAN